MSFSSTLRASVALLTLLLPSFVHAATGTVMPSPKFYCLDNNGAIVNGGKLFTYDAGGTVKRTTYSDSALTSANTNPVLCDSSGRATVFLTPGIAYKFTLAPSTDADPPTNSYWTVDNVYTVPAATTDLDITGTAGEALLAADVVYLSDGTGGCGATAGRWYKADADLTCASTTAQAIGFVVADIASAASGSIRIQGKVTGLAGLAAGTVMYISATAGAITSSAPTNQRAVGVADSGTTLVISSSLTSEPASATQAGIVNLTTQTLGTGTKSVDKLDFKPGAVTTFDARTSGSILGPFITSQATSGVAETSAIATAPTIKANLLNASGDVVRATYVGIASANATVTIFRVKLGGTTISTFSFTPNATAAAWKLVVEIHRTAAATQNIVSHLVYSENLSTSSSYTPLDVQAGTKDLTTALTLDVTMEKQTAGSITFKGAWYEVLRGS
jgi:hypothetical protein